MEPLTAEIPLMVCLCMLDLLVNSLDEVPVFVDASGESRD